MQKLKDCVLYAPEGLNRVASHAMAGNEDAIVTACRRYATHCGVAYLKARIQWPLFIQPFAWLATI